MVAAWRSGKAAVRSRSIEVLDFGGATTYTRCLDIAPDPLPGGIMASSPAARLLVPILLHALAAGAAAQEPYLAGKSGEWITAAAVLAAPEALRDGAEVRAWTDDSHLVTLRPGNNSIVCLGPRPGVEGFAVACYHESLEAFMERGRELLRQGVEGRERDELRWQDIRDGTLDMPAAAMVYNLRLPDTDFDPATVDPATGARLHALYIRDATAEATGLPARPTDGAWLMFAGTPSAHVMFFMPPRAADEDGGS
jgi:hypothetical protein